MNGGRVAAARVEAAARPARMLQPQTVQHRVEEGVAQAGGGAEKAWRLAGDVAQRGLGGGDVAPHAARAEQREGVGVPVAVVLHPVAARHDGAAQRRVRLGAVADAEEAGAGAEFVQRVQHTRGDLGVGAIVDGDGEFAARSRGRGQVRPVGPEPLRMRPQAGADQGRVVGHHAAGQPGPPARLPQTRAQRGTMHQRAGREQGCGAPTGLHHAPPSAAFHARCARKADQRGRQQAQSCPPSMRRTRAGGKRAAMRSIPSAKRSWRP